MRSGEDDKTVGYQTMYREWKMKKVGVRYVVGGCDHFIIVPEQGRKHEYENKKAGLGGSGTSGCGRETRLQR